MPLYSAGENGLQMSMEAYDPKIGEEVDRQIRHMPFVVDYLMKKAQECQAMTSDHFHVVLSNNPDNQRARAYVAPADDAGIHQELADSMLLKAAMNMDGR